MLKLLNLALNQGNFCQGSIVSAVTGTAGGTGGAAGVGFQAQAADLDTPTTTQQAQDQYTNANSALTGQQQFLQAVQAQNGLGNQSQVYNQLQGVANGTGPNPAQAQLAQSTAANTANQAALMAGQRGSSQNTGLIARQAAMQGAANQQNSAGQAATLQANQSLNAIGQAGTLATNQANQQASAQGAYTQSALNEQQNVLSAIAAQNSAKVGQTSSMNSANAGIANTVAGGQMALVGNLTGGGGSAAALAGARGGVVQKFAQGTNDKPVTGVLDPNSPAQAANSSASVPPAATPAASTALPPGSTGGPKSSAGKFFSGSNASLNDPNASLGRAGASIGHTIGQGIRGIGSMFSSSSDASNTPAQMTAGQSADIYQSRKAQGLDTSDASIQQQFNASGSAYTNGASDPYAAGQASDVTDPSEQTTPAPTDPNAALAMDGDPSQQAMAQGGNVAMLAKFAPMFMSHGGAVPALLSPGEKYLPPQAVKAVERGADPLAVGKKVPGKPKVKGAKNSYANDTVPATLQEGGVVLPRSVTQAKNPHWAAHKFVSDLMAKQGKSLPKKSK